MFQRYHFVMLMAFLIVQRAPAQDSLVVTPVSAQASAFAIDAIAKITFTDSAIEFRGPDVSFAFSGLRKLAFKNATSVSAQMPDPAPFSRIPAKIRQYNGAVLVTIDCACALVASIRIISMDGRITKTVRSNIPGRGMHTISLHVGDLAGHGLEEGIFVVQVSAGKGINMSQTIHIMK